MKNRILIIYEDFSAGGSTTSLLALLNAWDYSRYSVDLLPYRLSKATDVDAKMTYEQLSKLLPPQVNILENAVRYGKSPINKIIKGIRLLPSVHFYKAMKAAKNGKNKYVTLQHMGYAKTHLCREVSDNYRAAIAFIEGWSTAYLLSKKIKADKKIAFVHLDYKTAGADPEIDRAYLGKADAIVAVSENCRNGLSEIYPEYKEKIVKIENLHQSRRIKELSQERLTVPFPERTDFLTVCRPDIHVKGLDRLLEAAVNLRDSGYKFTWAVVGGGSSEPFLKMLAERELEDIVLPIELTDNPYPYFLKADWLVVTSRTEAKPMTVTEAQILGKPCIVTEYSSANEQIENGVNGIITENTTDGIIRALKNALDDSNLRARLASAQHFPDYDGKEELEKLYRIIG